MQDVPKEVILEKNLEKLTVVIPVFNRQSLINRQINYWSGTGAHIIILDGSIKPLAEDKIRALNLSKNIEYLYFNESFANRFSRVKNLDTRSYIVFSCDDYFHLKSSVSAAIEFLENNNTYVGCGGQRIFAKIDNSRSGIQYSFIENTFVNYQLDSENYIDRLTQAFKTYNGVTNFAILRAEVWKQSWGSLNVFYSSTNIYEMQQAYVVHAMGKIATLDLPFMLCTNEYPAINNKEDNRLLLFENWWRSSTFQLENQAFLNSLSSKLSQIKSISLLDAQKLTENILDLFVQTKISEVGNYNSGLRKRLSSNPLSPKKFSFEKYLPKKIKLYLRNVYLSYMIKRTFVSLETFVTKSYCGITITQENIIDLMAIDTLINDYRTAMKLY